MAKILLLIEDDKIVLDMYQQLLSNHGYLVHTAMDGEDGLKKALEDHPDLILLDIRMPKMDGMTVLKHLRADAWGKDAKVIILTNLDASDQILNEVVKEQPTYYLIKSNTKPEQVIERIKEVVGEEKNIYTE
jgi:two-component system, NtrC family, response regulator AtoC